MKHTLSTVRRSGHKPMHALALSLVLLILGSAAGLAQSGPFLDISPSHPTTEDVVFFTVSGTWHDGCVPKFHDGRIHGFVVEIRLATSSGSCTRALTKYSERIETKKPLAAGTYETRIFINGHQRIGEFFTVAQAHHQRPVVAFRSAHVSVDENDHSATVYVERTGSSEGTISVDVRTTAGTATGGADYEHIEERLTWHHGDTSAKMVSIRLFDDFEFEGTEDFRLELSHPSGADLGHPSSTTIEIVDDEKKHTGGMCQADFRTLCLQDGRFAVTVRWRTQQGKAGEGNPGAFTDETGYFWFFSNKNIEVLIKILDGCGLNDSYWVYVAGLTNIWVEVEVRDTQTGEIKTWTNPMGQSFRPIEETGYFDCSAN